METRFKIAASGTAVDEAGLKYDMSDFDGYAVETALQLNEKQGPGETVVISLGPDVVQEQLRKALSMGADRAVQLKAERVPTDGLVIARALAAELKGGAYDLIFFGRQAVDSANATVGPMVAELLGLPCATAVSTLDIANGRGTARRDLEGAAEIVEFALPAVVTIDEGMPRARYPSLKGIMAAKKKEIKDMTLAELGVDAKAAMTVTSYEAPPVRKAGVKVASVDELVQKLHNEAKVI